MASYLFVVFDLISSVFSSSSSVDAAEDSRIFAELCRRGASVSVIEEHYDAINAKSDRNRRYWRSMDREMTKLLAEEAVAEAMFSMLTPSLPPVARRQNWYPSSGSAHAHSHADAGLVPGTVSQIAARNSTSSNASTMLESDVALTVELVGGSQPSPPESQGIDDPVLPGDSQPSPPESQGLDDPVFSGGIDLESQTHIEDSSAEYRVTLVHRILFGNEANTGVAVRNVIELSGASSDGVVAPLVWIGFIASLFAPLVRRKWPWFAKELSLIGHISTAWWHLVLLSTKYRSEQYSFVNSTLTALFCIVVALALIRAGR